MPLSRESIEDLRRIHHEETGELLSDDEMRAMGERLLRLYDVLTRSDATRASMLRSSSPVRFDRRNTPE
jgi:hypothetical protein